MSKFKAGDIVIRQSHSKDEVKLGGEYTIRAINGNNIYLKGNVLSYDIAYFKLKENNMKQFTKGDLRTGMRVTTRSGDNFIVMLDTPNHGDVLSRVNAWLKLSNYTYDLKYHNSDGPFTWSDIMSVTTPKFADFYAGGGENSLIVLWQRQEKSQAQIELETLQSQITALQEQAKKLESTIK